MKRKTGLLSRGGLRAGISIAVLVGAGLLGISAPGYSQTNGEERRDDRQGARDTRQGGREDARDAKAECKEGDDSRAECRQQKRETKEDSRDAARDIKKND